MTTPPSPPPAPAGPAGADRADESACAEFRLLVWISPSRGWRARIVGADAFERDFASPFELARFVAWPMPPAGDARVLPRRGPGLR